jgi:hypothetical protein
MELIPESIFLKRRIFIAVTPSAMADGSVLTWAHYSEKYLHTPTNDLINITDSQRN